MNPFLEGIGKAIGKISDQISGRIERLKNEKDKLNAEKTHILSKSRLTSRDADRVYSIDVRIGQIKTILANKASDS